MRTIVNTDRAPAPIGPYNQAVKAGNFLYVSGQIPLSAETGELVSGSIETESRQVLENVGAILAAAGYRFEDVVKTSIFLVDMSDFAAVNEVYATYFTSNEPARETIAVKGLPKGVRVEISVIAYRQ
jgi:2-iminobutanoate/2-iminopropanoate deaminase